MIRLLASKVKCNSFHLRVLSKCRFRYYISPMSTISSDKVVTMCDLNTYTSQLEIIDTKSFAEWQQFRLLDENGHLLNNAAAPADLDKEKLLSMYRMIIRIQTIDDIFYNAQRQGRISFYMQCTGEEAIHIGTSAALDVKDVVLAQYRELGVLLWRGFTLQQVADQCFSNESDFGKGRQMPIHYGSKELSYQTISSPLATQMPQAVGVAYALKMKSNNKNISVCYFGEGAASEGDFHAAMNFASTLEVPMLFICRNNGYAISTPTKDQYRGDGIASRATGYGMYCIRVDGNDIFAMYEATKEAKRMALDQNRPVLIEAMTYRVGHHSTSDDSTRYRSISEINHWHQEFDPLKRLQKYIMNLGYWSSDDDLALRDSEKVAVLNAIHVAEKKPKPSLDSLFQDVYKDKPENLIKQEKEMLEHIQKYPEYYSH